jgi:SPP1 family phage portal protein
VQTLKTLDLYSPPPVGIGLKNPVSDKQFLEREIEKWLASAERRQQIAGGEYYDGVQEIRHRERTVVAENGKLQKVEYLPNNHLIDNQYAKMVDQKTNYLLGKPITFDTEDTTYGEALSQVFGKKAKRKLKIVGEKAIIGGKAWVWPYYDSNGDFTITIFDAYEVLPFWADAEHTDLDCAVHLFPIFTYEGGDEKIVQKVEVIHGGGAERFIWDNGLQPDPDAQSSTHLIYVDPKTKKETPYNWERIPLICFKFNHHEQPLLNRVKCLQDALNLVLSNFVNQSEEDVHNTVLVLRNYDGENLGEFRRNLATYGAVKVRSFDGGNGGVDTLKIEVDADNYKLLIDLLKKAIIENARGYDAKDERMSGTPNQMNIQSMYSDIDLDANGMQVEFQAAFDDLLWFVNQHLANTGKGNYENTEVDVIFNRDILVSEGEAIDNCSKSVGIISNETIVRQHPWVDDPEEELKRLKEEQDAAAAEADPYRAAFESTTGKTPTAEDGDLNAE